MTSDLFLIRHAHRDKPVPDRDNGLSEKGRSQVANLREYFAEVAQLDGDVRLLSSPKKRCRQTVEKLLGRETPKLKIDATLDEQNEGETLAALQKRVHTFCLQWKKKTPPRTLIVCSHGDWLPLALAQLLGLRIDLKKGGVVWIRREGKAIQLVEVRQWL